MLTTPAETSRPSLGPLLTTALLGQPAGDRLLFPWFSSGKEGDGAGQMGAGHPVGHGLHPPFALGAFMENRVKMMSEQQQFLQKHAGDGAEWQSSVVLISSWVASEWWWGRAHGALTCTEL